MRRGRPEDFAKLGAVEIDAARRYAEAPGYEFVAELAAAGAVREPHDFERGLRAGALFVAEASSEPIGFALCWSLDGQAHLTEISVAYAQQGRGVGRALIDQCVAWASASLFDEITLTCYRDAPWTAPFYQRLGWREISRDPSRLELEATIREEADYGYHRKERIVMSLALSA